MAAQAAVSSVCASRCATRGPGPRPALRRPVVVRAEQPSGRDAERQGGGAAGAGPTGVASGGALELPGGALWWQHLHSRGTTPLYGDNFVLQRPTVGGPGLIKATRPPAPVRRPPPPAPLPPIVWQRAGAGSGLALAGGSLGAGSVIVDTEFIVLSGSGASAAAPTIAPNTTCTGIVWQPREEAEEEGQEAAAAAARRRRGSGRHPRRTQMLRFTCNLCGEVNEGVEVNPHAWAKGSVFARCQGCTAVHKLRDNLNIFHELSGPVFPPRELRANYLVQEILDRIRDKNNGNAN